MRVGDQNEMGWCPPKMQFTMNYSETYGYELRAASPEIVEPNVLFEPEAKKAR